MSRKLLSLVIASLLCLGVAWASDLPPSVQNDREFLSFFDKMTGEISRDKHYKRIPLDTPEQANEFVVQLHRLYRNEISDVEFMTFVAMRYPGQEYETSIIVTKVNLARPKKK